MTNPVPRYRLLGVEVDALTQSDLNSAVRDAVEGGKSLIVATHNLHSIHFCHQSSKMRKFYAESKCIVIDGMSVVALGRILGLPLKRSNRLAILDSIGPILAEAAQKGWRIFHLGNTLNVARYGASRLRTYYPGLQIALESGYFDATPGSDDNRKILGLIHDYRPHILLVGMGMPRQEHWVVENLEKLSGLVIINVGAYLSYAAGDIPTAPRWIGQLGLEWLFRLFSEPQRLWYRYLVEPWLLVRLLLKQEERELPSD
jgi:N-acetylglucosaminyldiphosphoundecaprenol N-acetyl-beta-D-mannosaminyltransferase